MATRLQSATDEQLELHLDRPRSVAPHKRRENQTGKMGGNWVSKAFITATRSNTNCHPI